VEDPTGMNFEHEVNENDYHNFDNLIGETPRPDVVDQFRAEITKAGAKINQTLKRQGLKTDIQPILHTQVEMKDVNDFIAEPDTDLAQIAGTLKQFLELKKQEDAEDTTDKYARKNFKLAVFVGVVTGIGGVIALASLLQSIVNAVSSSTPPPPTGDPDIDKKLADLYAYVKNTTDDEFWNQMAAFVEMKRTWTLYLADQLAFMNYVIDWFPFLGEWVWASGTDKLGFVNDLVAAYKADGLGAIYRKVATFSYAGDVTRDGPVPLPRAIAADVVRLAVAKIISEIDTVPAPRPVTGSRSHGHPMRRG
jgi:hypothetical protein